MHPRANLVPVDDQRSEGRDHEEREEPVQQRGPRCHEAHSVADHQHSGDAADQSRPADAPDGPGHHHHQTHTQQRAGEPPPQAGVAEQGLADGDQLFADRRMDDQAEPRIVFDPVVVEGLPGLWGVVLLVEDRRAGIGRRTQVEEPGCRRQHGDDSRHEPPAQPIYRTEIGDRHQRGGAEDRCGTPRAGLLVKAGLADGGFSGRGGHHVDRRLSVMTSGRLLLAATPLGQPADASPRLT